MKKSRTKTYQKWLSDIWTLQTRHNIFRSDIVFCTYFRACAHFWKLQIRVVFPQSVRPLFKSLHETSYHPITITIQECGCWKIRENLKFSFTLFWIQALNYYWITLTKDLSLKRLWQFQILQTKMMVYVIKSFNTLFRPPIFESLFSINPCI